VKWPRGILYRLRQKEPAPKRRQFPDPDQEAAEFRREALGKDEEKRDSGEQDSDRSVIPGQGPDE
jgi:hypothetical protein